MATITTKETRDFSWADFDRSALKVGDEISEVLKDGREVIFVVMDDGVIGLKDCLGERRMNDDWTNRGGWLATEMHRYLNEDVFALLPDDLQAVIKPRAFGEEQDKLWLFSEAEIFGEHDWTEKETDRGVQLEYFKTPANRIKCDENGDPTWWWERSPYASHTTPFCNVYSSGYAYADGASYARGVCFGFCV